MSLFPLSSPRSEIVDDKVWPSQSGCGCTPACHARRQLRTARRGHGEQRDPQPERAYNGLYGNGSTYSVASSNGVSHFDFIGSNNSGNVNIDNVTVNTVVATPEPASMVLLGTGLLGVFGAARRIRKRA